MKQAGSRTIAAFLAFAAIDLVGIPVAPLITRPRQSDYAIVFGNTVLRDGSPSPRLKARLDRALELYRSHLVSKVLVSGGFEPDTRQDEAEGMMRYLLTHGVPAAAIVQDSQGDNSMSTARNARALIPTDSSIILVTQWFHVARATVAMRRLGFQEVSAASAHFFEARDLYSFFREAVALPYYLVRPVPSASVAPLSSARQGR